MKLKMIFAALCIFFLHFGCSRQYDDELKIYFVEGPSPMKVCSIDINGNNREIIREFPGYDVTAPGITASTDGEFIAVSLYNTASLLYDLILMKTDGTDMRVLYSSTSSPVGFTPSFTYTGNEIAFRNVSDLKFINTNGDITATYSGSGTFSPLRPFCLTSDRYKVIMAVTQAGNTKIFMGDLLNNATYQVNSGNDPTYITFDPLDNDIYFLITNNLYTVKLPTSFPATVSGLPAPLASALTSISLSADGEYIAAISTGFNLMLYDSTGTLVRTLTSGGNVYASCFESRPR
ncbi:MAG: hypothetical protein CVV49_07540 [Spirochaetae bacterium HGW-Spirochaetae-5]|nr:MAG: hypothetical protein CVV49_07540 [Spirochaetae bacterium HGW-Spirochaetae-5]